MLLQRAFVMAVVSRASSTYSGKGGGGRSFVEDEAG